MGCTSSRAALNAVSEPAEHQEPADIAGEVVLNIENKNETNEKTQEAETATATEVSVENVEKDEVKEDVREPEQVTESPQDAPAASSPSATGPELKLGWLIKEGHVVRNWKRRYFVLEEGTISYYEGSQFTPPYGVNCKGSMALTGMQVSADGKIIHISPTEIQPEGETSPDLRMEATSDEEALEWSEAIQAHIDFVIKNPNKGLMVRKATKRNSILF